MKAFLGFVVLFGCQARTFVGTKNSDTNALVSKEQLQLASEISKYTESYIPLEYVEDGCFLRSYFVSLAFASAGIPSSSVFVRSSNIVPLLVTLNEKNGRQKVVSWEYHVAPLVLNNNKTFVFDSVLFPEGQVSLEEWTKKVAGFLQSPIYFFKSGSESELSVEARKSKVGWLKLEKIGRQEWIKNLSEMKAYSIKEMNFNCSYLASMMRRKVPALSQKEIESKTLLLGREVRKQLPLLARRGLLDGNWRNFACNMQGSKKEGQEFVYEKEKGFDEVSGYPSEDFDWVQQLKID